MFNNIRSAAESIKQSLCNSLGLPFPELLKIDELDEIVKNMKIEFNNSIFTPVVTLLAFIAQVLDSDGSCRQTVSRIISQMSLISTGRLPSQNTAAYCKARLRLPLSFLWKVIEWTTKRIDSQVETSNLWLGRHKVRIVDGSSCQTPDTDANRNEFGLPGSVKLGCGLPVLFFVAIFSLETGLLQYLQFTQKGSHERHSFRKLITNLSPEEVILGDRGFCSFTDILLIKQQGAECIFRIFNRKPDYQTGERLGKQDHIVEWEKPKTCPAGMSEEDFASLPDKIRVREVCVIVEQKGFRSKKLDIVTTLLDASFYTKEAIASLYRRRWSIELNFRHIKTTLGMELLRTKTPEMARKEVLVYMIAYNLMRSLIWTAKKIYNIDIQRISFKGTVQHLSSLSPYLAIANRADYAAFYEKLIKLVAKEKVPDRPDRIEPRVVKRRPKPFPLMTKPRSQLKTALII